MGWRPRILRPTLGGEAAGKRGRVLLAEQESQTRTPPHTQEDPPLTFPLVDGSTQVL